MTAEADDDAKAPAFTEKDAAAFAARFLPEFRAAKSFEDPPTPARHLEDGSFLLGHQNPHALIYDFIEASYERNLCYSYDWPTWMRERGKQLFDAPGAIEQASLLELRKLVTAMVRADRFGPGVVLDAAKSGVLTRILERLAALGSEAPR